MEVEKWRVTVDLAKNHLKYNTPNNIIRNDLQKLIDIFEQTEVNKLALGDVSKRSELLLAFLRKYIKVRDSSEPNSTDLEILTEFESQL